MRAKAGMKRGKDENREEDKEDEEGKRKIERGKESGCETEGGEVREEGEAGELYRCGLRCFGVLRVVLSSFEECFAMF
jgi:hypothetical protein